MSSFFVTRCKLVSWVLIVVFGLSCFCVPSSVSAQSVLSSVSSFSPTIGIEFRPSLIRGLMIYPDRPLEMDFIISQGDDVLNSEDSYREQSQQMVRDFMAAMTLPDQDLWVNLSPYEKDRVIPDSLGVTEMGREFLVLDYELKKLTASLMSPESEAGKKFWDRVYESARQQGITDIPTELFHKVWIAPEKAVVFQRGQSVFIADSHLKVMLEEDYLASGISHLVSGEQQNLNTKDQMLDAKSILRQTIIPVIEREVNEGQIFARLRQIYHAIIMAKWYKQHLKQSILGQVYADQSKVSGLESGDPQARQRIYEQYLQVFQQGSNQIQDEYDPATQQIVAKNYFSGGLVFDADNGSLVNDDSDAVVDRFIADTAGQSFGSWPVAFKDAAMLETVVAETSIAKVETAFDIADIEDDLPFNISFLSGAKYYSISGIPDVREIQQVWKNLQPETRIFFALALLPQNYPPEVRKEAGFLNAVAYVRQLLPQDRDKVLNDIAVQFEAYELAGWLKNNNKLSLDDMTPGLKKFFGLTITDGVKSFIRFHDEVLSVSRALRLGMEVVTRNQPTTKKIIEAMDVINRNVEINDVIHGVRTAAVVSLKAHDVINLRRAFRAMGIVEGYALNIVRLGGGQYYIYDENRLKKEAVNYFLNKLDQGKESLEPLDSLEPQDVEMYQQMWTESGLEDLILEHNGQQKGLFYDVLGKDINKQRSQQAHRIFTSIMSGKSEERLTVWDKKLGFPRAVVTEDGKILTKRMFVIEREPLDTSFQATFNREILFPRSMEIEVLAQVIFNYQTDIVVLDDSNGVVEGTEKKIRDNNEEIMKRLSEEYGIVFYHMDLKHRDKEYEHYTHVLAGVYQEWINEGIIPFVNPAYGIKENADPFWLIGYHLAEKGVLVDGQIQKPALRKVLEESAFLHIAGVRNRQALIGIGLRAIMGFDDDAPHGARAVTEAKLNRVLSQMEKKKAVLEQAFLREIETALGVPQNSYKTKSDFYRSATSEQLKNEDVIAIRNKYYTFDPNDPNKGLIPQSMGQIRSLEGEYYRGDTPWGQILKTTNQRIDHFMSPQKMNLQVASVYRQKLEEKNERLFPVNYSRQSRYLGMKAGDTDLPVLVKTLRGLLASNASPQEIKDTWDRIINIVAFDFNGDTDTNGRSQFLNYILSSSKMRDELQSVGEKLLLFMRGSGSVGPDNWPVFNRMVASYLDYIFPTVGGPFRLEEPLLNMLSIHPSTQDMFITANGKVVGSQIRIASQRLYVIATQGRTEIAAAAAKRAYLGAVAEFRELLANDPILQKMGVYDIYRILGSLYIKHATAFKLNGDEKEFLKGEQIVTAQMMSELGTQRAERYKKWKEDGSDPTSPAYQEILDMDIIMLQYATDFKFYDAKSAATDYTKKEKLDYTPQDPSRDVFYKVVRVGNRLKIIPVIPDMKVETVNNKHHAISNEWVAAEGESFYVDIDQIDLEEPVQVGQTGRSIFLIRVPEEGAEAIVPYVSEERHEQFYENIDHEIHRQVGSADGFQMLIWKELVGAAIPWREFGFLKRDNVDDLELDADHLKDLSARIVDEMNRGIKKDGTSSLKMLDTYIHMNPDEVDQVASVGLIEGTGMNTSVMDPLTGIIYNEESGGFDRLDGVATPEDLIIIKNSSPENKQVFEKMVAGNYIGERVRQYLLSYHNAGNFLPDQNYVPFLYQAQTFSATLMTNIEKISDAKEIIALLKADQSLGLSDVDISKQDALRVKEVVRAVYRQAARLLAAKIAADIQWIDKRDQQKYFMDVKRQHLVLAEGTVLEKAPFMEKEINKALIEIMGAEDAKRIHFTQKGSIPTGGVAAALIAQGKTSGEVIVIDTGGSNSRVYLAAIRDGEQEATILNENPPIKFDGTDLRTTSFRDFLERTIVQQIKDLKLPEDQEHVISWTFAFPVKQTGYKSGIVPKEELSKGFKWNDLLGNDPVEILEEVLRDQEMSNIQVVILLNDTPRRQLALKADSLKIEFSANGHDHFNGVATTNGLEHSGNGLVTGSEHAGNGVQMAAEVTEDKASLVDNGGLDLTRFDLDVKADKRDVEFCAGQDS